MLRRCELVVGGPRHHSAPQRGDRVVADHRAEGARREDVALLRVDLVGLRRVDAEVADGSSHRVDVDVRDDEAGTGFVQVLAQVVADLPDPLDGHAPPGERRILPRLLGACDQPLEHAPRGHGRRVPRPAHGRGDACYVAGLAADHVHVLTGGADVLGRDVSPTERIQEPAVRPEQRLGLDALRVADDDGLPPTEVQSGGRGLVRHAAGQPEHVAEGVFLGLERIEACPAERWAERGGVDGDDAPELGGRVVEEDDLLELLTQLAEYPHLG